MLQFISIHLKHVLSAGFVLGLLSLVVKVLDEKLPQATKDKFSDWVQNSAPKVQSANITSIFCWSKTHKTTLSSLYAFFIVVSVIALEGFSRRTFEISLAAIILGACAGGFILSAATMRRAVIRCVVLSICFVLPVGTMIGVLYESLSYRVPSAVNPYTDFAKGFGIFLVVFVITLAVLFVLLFFVLPIAFVVLLRPPIIICGRCLLWLSSYPKGPWTGLVFVLTVFLGALRLFL
jgi:hypothetical protein